LAKAHCRADMPYPILRCSNLCADQPTCHIRNQLDLWSMEGTALRYLGKFSQHWLHQRGMKGMRYPQAFTADTLCLKSADERFKRSLLPRDDYFLRRVHRCDTGSVGIVGDEAVHGGLIGENRGHPAARR